MPRGSIYTTIMELGPQNHNGDGLLGANSIIVMYMDPLGCCNIIGARGHVGVLVILVLVVLSDFSW